MNIGHLKIVTGINQEEILLREISRSKMSIDDLVYYYSCVGNFPSERYKRAIKLVGVQCFCQLYANGFIKELT